MSSEAVNNLENENITETSIFNDFSKRLHSLKIHLSNELKRIVNDANPQNREITISSIDKCMLLVQEMQSDFTQNSANLPGYTKRQTSETLLLLTNAITAARHRVSPTTQFKFYPSQTENEANKPESTILPHNEENCVDETAVIGKIMDGFTSSKDQNSLTFGDLSSIPRTAPDLHSSISTPDIRQMNNAIIYISDNSHLSSTNTDKSTSTHIDNSSRSLKLTKCQFENIIDPSNLLSTYIRRLNHFQHRDVSTTPIETKQPSSTPHPTSSLITPHSLTPYILEGDLRHASLWLSELRNCIICIEAPLISLKLDRLTNVVLLSGPVGGSVYVDQAINSVINVGCRQLRIHHAKNVDFAVHTTSKPIIEHCNTLRFSPFTYVYSRLEEHCNLSQITPSLLHTLINCNSTQYITENTIVNINSEKSPIDQISDTISSNSSPINSDTTTTSSFCLLEKETTDSDVYWGIDIEGEKNAQWALVDDFNWLRTQASPNWGVCERKHRLYRYSSIIVNLPVVENQ